MKIIDFGLSDFIGPGNRWDFSGRFFMGFLVFLLEKVQSISHWNSYSILHVFSEMLLFTSCTDN